MLKYLPTALLSRGPFRLSVKCYPAACTANILNLKINSGCLVEFGASSGCTSRVSNWGWQAPCPAPAQFLCFFVPPAQACVRKCSRRRVLLYKPGLSAALRFSQGFDLVPRFRKCFLPRWPSGNVLPGKLFVGNIRAVRTEPAFTIKGKCCSRINTLEVVDTCLDCEVCLEAPERGTGGERRTSGRVNCKHVHIACPPGQTLGRGHAVSWRRWACRLLRVTQRGVGEPRLKTRTFLSWYSGFFWTLLCLPWRMYPDILHPQEAVRSPSRVACGMVSPPSCLSRDAACV